MSNGPLTTSGALSLIVFSLAVPLFAQQPAFEVASVKLNPGTSPWTAGIGLRHGSLTAANATLRAMLAAAFGMAESRIIGPKWLDDRHFDLMAKSPQGVPDSQMKPMLQSLLSERFGLKEHRETREMPIYDLVIAKGGVKMPVFPKEVPPATYPRGFPMARGSGTIEQLAKTLAQIAGRPVFDKTGVAERYNYVLSFAPLTPRTESASTADEPTPPDLFKALQEQLGLRLEANKGSLEVVIVDRIERTPSGN